MLVLSRQRDETIMIGDAIELTVVDIRGDKVRIGINAPASVAVHRKEIYDAIRAENHGAATIDAGSLPAIQAPALAAATAKARRPHKSASKSPANPLSTVNSACR